MNEDKMSSNSVEAEYMDIANRNAWSNVYQKISRECQLYPYTCTEAKKPQNKPLNRYRDVNPYDHSRIILQRCERDYINANLVKVLVALNFFAVGDYQTDVGDIRRHCVAQSSVSKAVKQVTLALNKPAIINKYVCFPFRLEERQQVKREFYRRFKMPGCLACIDGTHVAIVCPHEHEERYYNRKDYHSLNVQLMEQANRKYILTQGPLAFTVSHFWLMIWEQNSRAILMLNKIIEKNEVKCHWYWPYGAGEQHKMELTDVKLTVEQIGEEDCSYYRTRVFRIFDHESSQTREVIQFHYTTWPDFGVPSSPVAFLDFLRKVRSSGCLNPDVGPAVVHCSAGIGRSGTFCLVDSCLVIIEKEGLDSVNIQQILLKMRRDRMGLIQTPDQLRFSYQAIIEGAKRLENWEEDQKMEESIYVVPADEEEAPPPPPPRAESLTRAPARPLPAIPTSTSLGNLVIVVDSSSSDESPPTPPAHESSSQASSADDEDDEPTPQATESGEVTETLRRRRTRELADRVSAMKRRARDAEKWHALKRSLYKPLTITFGFILAGIFIYNYVRH